MKIECSNISVRYKNGVQALKDVSCELAMGMYGLIGPNGAGKTTLMKVLASLIEPSGGALRIDEKGDHAHRF
ncbi:MAG: ATP-binding cassette domain-containing protein [Clostridia bacterium]